MEHDLHSQLRQGLLELLGPRRFIAGGAQSARIGTAWPASIADVQHILTFAQDAAVSVIPRGATSNPFAGPEPDAGLVVAFDHLARIGRANTRSSVVRVQPGLIWHTLIDHLARVGLMPRTYPSSEGYSTVGGFVAQSGVGIGSYQFGEIGRNISSVRIVDATGTLRRMAGSDLQLVVGAEGRTGLIVEVILRLQELGPMTPIVALFDALENAEQSVQTVAGRALPLWSVSLLDPAACALQSQNWPALALPDAKHAVLFAYRQRDGAAVFDALRESIAEAGGQLLEKSVAESNAWLVQFASLTALGTTPIPMQYRLPGGQLSALVSRLPPELRGQLAIEAVVVDGGATVAARMFFTERTNPEDNAKVARQLLALAKQAGGRCYTTGAVYLEEAEAVFGAGRLAELRAFRHTVDPDNRLNPGRAFD